MSKEVVLHGRGALDAYRKLQNRTKGMDARRQVERRQAFDAAGSSGRAWLQSQLELLNPNPVEPLMAETHARDIPIKVGGGFPEWLSSYATNYASSGGGYFGLQGTNNTEIAEAQFDVQKGLWPTFLWASGFTMTYFDLQRQLVAQSNGQPLPFAMQTMFNKSVDVIWNKALDYVSYVGFNGNVGLCNNPQVPVTYAVNGGGGTTWASKSPTQILSDINFGINQTVVNSGYDMKRGAANTLLIPYQQWAALTLPMTVGGIPTAQSTLDYIKKNCVAAGYGIDFQILPLPNVWISGVGMGGSDRGVFYRKNEEDLLLQIPQPKKQGITATTADKGGAYQTMFVGCIGSLQFLRTTTVQYLDGI